MFAASVAAGITQTDINNWNAGTGGGGGGFSDYNDLTNKPDIPTNNNQLTNGAGYITSASLSGYALETWVDQNYQPKGSYAASNHNHSGVYQPAGNYLTSESDPTVPSHVKSITTTDIANWNAAGGGSSTPSLQQVTDVGASTNKSCTAPNWFCQTDGYTLGGTASGGARVIISNGLTYSSTSNVGVFTVSNSGTVTASGDVTAFSDARLKENVETLDGSKVFEMRGVAYTMDGREGAGVIAQELRQIAPELVKDDGEYLSVAYGNLVGYLIEAVKELKAEVEELNAMDVDVFALPNSGAISMGQIKGEFNKGNSLSGYYGAASGIPTSGAISYSDFYGKSSGGGNPTLQPALNPTFGTPTSISNGFGVQVTNHDSAFTWSTSVTAGSSSIDSSGLVTVSEASRLCLSNGNGQYIKVRVLFWHRLCGWHCG